MRPAPGRAVRRGAADEVGRRAVDRHLVARRRRPATRRSPARNSRWRRPCPSPTRTHSNRSRKKAEPHCRSAGCGLGAQRLPVLRPGQARLGPGGGSRTGTAKREGRKRAARLAPGSARPAMPAPRPRRRALAGGGGAGGAALVSAAELGPVGAEAPAARAGASAQAASISSARASASALRSAPHSSSSVSIRSQLGSRDCDVAAERPAVAGLDRVAQRAGDDFALGVAGDRGDVGFEADGDDRHAAFELGARQSPPARSRPAGCRA